MDSTNRKSLIYLIIFPIIIMICLSVAINYYSFKRYPASGDEASLWFQSELFKEGKLWNNSLDKNVMGLFKRHHVVTTEEREYSKYPPGSALFFAMIPGDYNGFVANSLFNCVIYVSGLLILAEAGFPLFMLLVYAAFFIFSAMTVFNGASWFSHPGAAAFIALSLLFIVKGEKKFSFLCYFIAGLMTGICIFMRSFDAMLMLLSIFVYYLAALLTKTDNYRQIFIKMSGIFLGILPFFILFLIYQKIYTGSFLKSPYSLYVFSSDLRTGTGEKIGEITLTPGHYFKYGLGGLTPLWLKNMMRWTNPLVVPAAIFAIPFFLRKQGNHFLRLFVIIPVMFILGYALHNAPGGDSYGPRYYYPAMVCWFSLASFTIWYIVKRFKLNPQIQAVLLFIIAISTTGILIHKHFAVARNIKDRFNIYTYSERNIPNDRAIVFVNNAKTFDPAFYIRHKPDLSDRIIYTRKPENPELISTIRNLFPGRMIYEYNYRKRSGKEVLKRVYPEVK